MFYEKIKKGQVINIEVICKPRGTGKTHDLIIKSAETGIPILTLCEPKYIVSEANKLGLKIPEPLNISRYKWLKDNNGFRGSRWNGKLLIDDVDYLLREFLDAEVDTVTRLCGKPPHFSGGMDSTLYKPYLCMLNLFLYTNMI
jgi:hypothetical protein